MGTYVDERGAPVSSTETEKVVLESPVHARQGLLGRPVLMVLIGGLLLAAVAWVVAEGYGEAVDNDAQTSQQQQQPNASVMPDNQAVTDNTAASGEATQTAPTDRDPTAETGTGGASQQVSPTGTEKTQ